VGGVLNFAASGAGQVTAEQWLEHQDERVLLASSELLADHVAGYGPHLRNRYWHAWVEPLSLYFSRVMRGAFGEAAMWPGSPAIFAPVSVSALQDSRVGGFAGRGSLGYCRFG